MADYRKLERLVGRYEGAIADLDAATVGRLDAALEASYRNLEKELRKAYPAWESQGSLTASQRRLLLMDQLRPVLAVASAGQQGEYEALFTEATNLSHVSGATLADELVGLIDPGYPLQDFSSIPIEAAALQARDGVQRLFRHSEDFASRSSAIVEQGLIQGWGAARVAQQMRRELGTLKGQAETLARTETMSAFNDAAQQRYKQNKLDGAQWMVTPSEALCPFCLARNGNVYPVGKVRAPAHPRCRCILLPWTELWQEMGLTDDEFWQDYRTETIARAKADGVEPDYGPTYWERKAGQEKAPATLWQPATPAQDARAEAIIRERLNPTQMPPGHLITLNPRYSETSIDDVLNTISTPRATERVAKVRQFVGRHRPQAVFYDLDQPNEIQYRNTRQLMRRQEWAYDGTAFRKYTSPRPDAAGYTAAAWDHLFVETRGGRSGPLRVSSQGLNSTVREVIQVSKAGDVVSAIPHVSYGDTAEFLVWTHEMGHQVHFRAGIPSPPMDIKGSLSDYGTQDEYEWFAEHFVVWLLDAEAYRLVDPAGARFVEESLEKAIAAKRRL